MVNLLPTPKASDGPHGGPNQRDSAGNYYLPGQAVRLDGRWVATNGTDYGPAIRRWEQVLGRLAPDPTEAGTKGNRRLSPAFVEWMMGADPGWVTGADLGLSRSDQLKNPRQRRRHPSGRSRVPRAARRCRPRIRGPCPVPARSGNRLETPGATASLAKDTRSPRPTSPQQTCWRHPA
ncbi:hypothetical protein GCM10020000_53710 [Streptomyces olivoverticillatus]